MTVTRAATLLSVLRDRRSHSDNSRHRQLVSAAREARRLVARRPEVRAEVLTKVESQSRSLDISHTSVRSSLTRTAASKLAFYVISDLERRAHSRYG